MHIDFSKPVTNDYFSKLDDGVLERCTAFTRQVSVLHNSKQYFSENEQLSHCWNRHLGPKCSPCVKAISHCGIVFRGDSRKPSVIFEEGFRSKKHPCIESDNDFFSIAFDSRLVARKVGMVSSVWAPDEEKMVCSTKRPDIATLFPITGSSPSTYVYSCYAHSGIKIYETVLPLETDWVTSATSISLQEVMTPIIPPEHVICAWKVSRTIKQTSQGYLEITSEYQESEINGNIDRCVTEYSKHISFPKPEIGSKRLKVYGNGVVEPESA